MKPLGQFDQDYSDRMLKACFGAIVATAKDEATSTAILRNGEIYKALLTIMATMLATSAEAKTPRGIRMLSEDFSRELAKEVRAFKVIFDRDGAPFSSSVFEGCH